MMPNMEFKEEFKGCPIIDPLEEIKMKCDAITAQNLILIELAGNMNANCSNLCGSLARLIILLGGK